MIHVDINYINRIASSLRNFKKTNEYLWNMSCPICGDSTTNKLKARGYIFRRKNALFYKCHHCGISYTLGTFIQHVSPAIYDEYIVERYKSGGSKYTPHKDITDVFDFTKSSKDMPELLEKDSVLDSIKTISSLSETHPARKYCENRMLGTTQLDLLYFAPRFKEFTNTFVHKFNKIEDDHPRLIIPFFNEHGKMVAFQARAFGQEQPKYYTIKLDDEEKIYGLERADYSKTIYVTEGPLDSLFLDNAIAVSGSSFDTPFIRGIKTNCVLIIDNEPRNKEICKLLGKYIQLGYNVFIFPDNVQEKDINDLVKAGMSKSEIMYMIKKNTYQGIMADLRYLQWKRC